MRGHFKRIDLVVDTLVAEPGQRLEGHLHVGTMEDGTPIRLPVALINGNYPGPTLYIQSVSDGDELNGLAVTHEILRTVRPDSLSGRIIVVPIVNFHAFHARQAFSPIDKKKMNRCFPGNLNGTSSERIAHLLFEYAVSQADYCIDLHQGSIHPMIDEVRVRVGHKHPQHKACIELARVFGIGYIFNEKGPQGQLAQAAPDNGIPTIDPELGGCMGWDGKSIAKGVRGVQNVLRYYGFAEGDPVLPERQVLVDRLMPLLSNEGGFVYYKVGLYDDVAAHQPVAEVRDAFGNLREVIRATESGIFWSHPVYPRVVTGGVIGTIGIPVDYI
ncbi:MAG: succinylglutamate desuccinylase/aspartoacylase family protein [Candidatus Poribacteria bacterium]|nr:succinylglutamate desuccinylase/aspartoacylase family protein [Candidatus Poribacteria bacterium]MDE0503478.1 succinylglutamate desuccinylase/aspartoacylase family protein [Candidatus Poribacteria bacterium]